MSTSVRLTYAELNAIYVMVADEKGKYHAMKSRDNTKSEFWTNLREKMFLALVQSRSGGEEETLVQYSSDTEGLPEQPLGTYPVDNAVGYHGGTDPTWNAGNHLVTESDIPNDSGRTYPQPSRKSDN